MTSLAEGDQKNRVADVRFDDERMYVSLQDGREIAVPLWWYPRLLRATPEQRNNWEILPFGDALHWPDLDEDLDVHGFLIGARAPDARAPRASPIDFRTQAHADLRRAIQEHNGKPVARRYDESAIARYEGRLFAAGLHTHLIELAIEFSSPAAVVAFLLSAKAIIVKWLELREDRVIKIRRQDAEVVIRGSIDIDKAAKIFKEIAKKEAKPK